MTMQGFDIALRPTITIRSFAYCLLPLIFSGCTQNQENKDQKKIHQKNEVVELKPDMKVVAEDMSKEFRADEKAAQDKYANRVVEVTGSIRNVTAKDYITIVGAGSEFDTGEIGCAVRADVVLKSAYLSRNQKIRVVGKYETYTPATQKLPQRFIVLSECAVTELEPSKFFVVTSETLGAEFDVDADAAKRKYSTADFGISGIVDGTEFVFGDFRAVRLRTGTKTSISCIFATDEWASVDVGEKIVVRGTSFGYGPNPKGFGARAGFGGSMIVPAK